jgi:lipoyl(octanoyl) transferase
MPYSETDELQHRLLELRYKDIIDDILLILEHPPTITLGKFGKTENVLVDEQEMFRRGVALFKSDRGGDATFHCPGQMVLYPIMNLRARGGELRRYLHELEEVALCTLKDYGINAARWSEHPGIWVDGKQIGAIGLRISRSISMHGLSLNVNPDLSSFDVINLCGLPDKKATSMQQELGKNVDINGVSSRLKQCFASIFKVELESISAEQVIGDSLAQEIAGMV